jgi:glycosyltransferase involved in cell wall biosynthesis
VREASKRHGAPFVYDAHDAYFDWDSHNWYPRAFDLYLRVLERRCVRAAAGFVTVSDGVAALLERRYGRRPEVVRNLHDLRIDESGGPDVREAAGVGDDGFLLVLVGNEKPGDAIGETLSALTELPDRVQLAFLGRGYEKHDELIRELELTERVHIVDPVAPTQVTDAIRGADAGLVLYRGDEKNYLHALPNRFFHSVAAGLPVIYPPLPEISALADRHGLGLAIDPADPDSIAGAIRVLSEDPEESARYRANAERAREVLNWEQEEQRLREVVRSALGEDGEGGR